MTGRYEAVKDGSLSRLLMDTVKQAIRTLKSDPDTSEWAKGISLEHIAWEAPVHDIETSRHTPDDRDTYLIEGVTNGKPCIFELDYVHEEEGDRRSHVVFFEIDSKDHHLDGSVILPLEGEDGRPFVALRQTRHP